MQSNEHFAFKMFIAQGNVKNTELLAKKWPKTFRQKIWRLCLTFYKRAFCTDDRKLLFSQLFDFFYLTPNKKVDHFPERHVFLRERRTLVSWVRFKRFFAPKNVAFWNFAKWKSTRSKLSLYLFFYITQPTQPSPFLWPFNFFLKAQTINKRLHWKRPNAPGAKPRLLGHQMTEPTLDNVRCPLRNRN